MTIVSVSSVPTIRTREHASRKANNKAGSDHRYFRVSRMSTVASMTIIGKMSIYTGSKPVMYGIIKNGGIIAKVPSNTDRANAIFPRCVTLGFMVNDMRAGVHI